MPKADKNKNGYCVSRYPEIKKKWLASILDLIEECDNEEGKQWLRNFYKELEERENPVLTDRKESRRLYYEKNKERLREKNRKWAQENKEYRREYYLKYKDEINAKRRKRKKKNKEKENESNNS